jgi:hypothetical protein
LLSTGSAVLAFDGLDEILATAQRREFVDLVTSFCDQFPLCPVLVTSRLVGYDDAHLPDEFDEVVLEKFHDDEVLEYTKRFMKVVGGHDDKEATVRANSFYRQTTNNAADLRRNPLMLGLMAWLFNMRGDVPSNRPEIYRECAVLMFEKWDPDRDIRAEVPGNFDRLQLFSNLAAKIFGNPELSAGVEAQWLEREVRAFFQQVYENRGQAFEAARALVTFITGTAWVMSEVGDKVFAFTHQTFLEYFFARHIDDMNDTVKEVLSTVMPRVMRREWDMVSYLSLQIKTHRNLRRQNEALDQLLLFIADQNDKKQRAALVSFAARALEYLAGAEAHIKPLVADIVHRCVHKSDGGGEKSWKDVAQCAQCCVERREFVRSLIVTLLVTEFESGPSKDALAVKEAVSAFAGPHHFHMRDEQYLPVELASEVRGKLEPFIMERIEQSSFHAALAWEWYGVINRTLIARHGVVTYFNSTLWGLSAVDGLTAIAIAASAEFSIHAPPSITRRRATEALAALGSVGFSGLPLPRRLFSVKQEKGLQLSVWEALTKANHTSAAVAAGYLLQ